MKRTSLAVAVGWLVWAVTAAAPSAAAGFPAAEACVTLDGAVWHAGRQDDARPLVLTLDHTEGRWAARVFGHSRRYNWGDHWGRIAEVKEDGATVRLRVLMRIERDPWTDTGGPAAYAVTLARDGDGLKGSWTGTLRGVKGAGTAHGRFAPGRRPEGFSPARPGEHPRLLIRRGDIPALRKKAQTAWGRKEIERLKSAGGSPSSKAAALGLLYVLTGDRSHAAQARKLVEEDTHNWYHAMYVHTPAVRAVEGTIAYDLVHDTCDAAYRSRMADLFRRKLEYFYYPPVGGFNPNDVSNWSAMYRSGLGMAALGLLGDPGELPPAPREPEIARLSPTAGLKPDGAPVVKLVGGRTIGEWLFAGPLKVTIGKDVLDDLGGAAAARCVAGTTFTYNESPGGQKKTAAFAELDKKHLIAAKWAQAYKDPKIEGGVDFASATGRTYLTTCYLYTILDSPKAGLYRLDHGTKKMEHFAVYVSGRRVERGDVVQLGAGRHPVMVHAAIAAVGGWEIIESYVQFQAVEAKEAQAWLADWKAYYALDRLAWEQDRDGFEAGGRADPQAAHWLGVARQRIANWAERAFGDAGWNTEGEAYTQHAMRLGLPFAHCYRSATGNDLAPFGYLAQAMSLYAAKTIFGPDGARMPSYGPGGGPLGVDNYARGFGLADERLKPAVLWAWNRTQSLADTGKLDNPFGAAASLDGLCAAFRFVNYPLDLAEQNPTALMPRVVVDRRKGGHVFRSRWQDADDFVCTIFVDGDPIGGGGWRAPDWGGFRISGLGVDWAVRGIASGNGSSSRRPTGGVYPNRRLYGNVLVVPEVPIRDDIRGRRSPLERRVVAAQADDDGGGDVTADMDAAYIGVRGARSFAVDYSGSAGAACLVAVADTVTGSKGRNVWQLCTQQEHTVEAAGDGAPGFTIRAPNGATLRGTVVAPRPASVELKNVTIRHEINYHGRHSQADFKRTVISVCGEGQDFFFVVMTVQKGNAPKVTVEGAGTAARATVGGRVVRFDPRAAASKGRIVLEPRK